MAQVARKLVSQKKKRYQKDGFDLDLACELCVCVCVCLFTRRAARGVCTSERTQVALRGGAGDPDSAPARARRHPE